MHTTNNIKLDNFLPWHSVMNFDSYRPLCDSLYIDEKEEFLRKQIQPLLKVESKGHACHVFVNQKLQGFTLFLVQSYFIIAVVIKSWAFFNFAPCSYCEIRPNTEPPPPVLLVFIIFRLLPLHSPECPIIA